MKYTEVLKEREAQIEIKKILEHLNKLREEEIDKQAFVMLQEKYKEDEEVYLKKKEELKKLFDHHKKQYLQKLFKFEYSKN